VRKLAPVAALAVLLVSGASFIACSGPLLKLPKLAPGQGLPAPDGLEALAQATSHCANLQGLTAEIAVSGSLGGRRVRGRLLGGFSGPSVRLEAVAPFGQPFFIFVSTGDAATLLLPRDDRVLEHAPPDRVLDALTGLPLGPRELTETLTACVERDQQLTAISAGDQWRVITSSSPSSGSGAREIYLHRTTSSEPWRIVAVTRNPGIGHRSAGADHSSGWRAEYRYAASDVPSEIRLVSVDSRRFDVRLTLSQVDTRAAVSPEAFRVSIPASARPITIEDLRANGPFASAAK
jgi:hypothetical protein